MYESMLSEKQILARLRRAARHRKDDFSSSKAHDSAARHRRDEIRREIEYRLAYSDLTENEYLQSTQFMPHTTDIRTHLG